MNFPWFLFPQFPGQNNQGHGNQNWNPSGPSYGPSTPLPGMQGQGGEPTSPLPSFTPQQPNFQIFAVDPGAIRGCLYRNTYVWLNRRQSFWFYPTFVGRNSMAGFRWVGNRWVYFGIDLNQIQSFQCF